jgi:hypothetical protein
MSEHSYQMPSAMKFDFKMKFYASKTTRYRDFWNSADWPMVQFSTDFTDWAEPAFLTKSDYAFVDVTSKFVEMTINSYTAGAVGLWSVTLKGYGFNMEQFIRERMFVCLMQVDYRNASGVWTSTPWGIGFIGGIKSVAPLASSQRNGEFTIVVEGVGQYLSKDTMNAKVWGRYNIAKGKTCTWSSTLAEPSQLYNKGEFVGTQVTLGPENAVDGSTFGPPAVSSAPPSGSDLLRDLPDHAFVREVYLWPPSGYGYEYQWVSVSADVHHMVTKGRGYYFPEKGSDENRTCFWHTVTPWPGSPGGMRSDVGVFCFSRRRVEELFDLSSVAWVVEWNKAMNGGYLSAVEDFIVAAPNGAVRDTAGDGVFWSNNPSYRPSLDIRSGECSEHRPYVEWDAGGPWDNGPITSTSIPAGSGLARRIWDVANARWILERDTNTKADWMVTDIPSPAAWVDTEQWSEPGPQGQIAVGGPADYQDAEWAIVELGQLSCSVQSNFDPTTVNSNGVYMNLDTTFGLAPSGYAMVNNQKFYYTVREPERLKVTAWYGNSLVVGAGNPVYQFDSVANVAKTGYRIRDIKLWRKPNLSHILNGEVHASPYSGELLLPDAMIENPTPPPDQIPESWWLDWPGPGDPKYGVQIKTSQDAVTSGLVSIDLGFDPANPEKHRYVKVMILCQSMRGNTFLYPEGDSRRIGNGGYFMLNEIEIYLDEVTGGGEPLASNLADVLKSIFKNELKFPVTRLDIWPFIKRVGFASQTTTKTNFQTVLSEMLQSYGAVIVEKFQGVIAAKKDPWWPDDSYAPQYDYMFNKSSVVAVPQEYGALSTVAQSKVICRDPDGRMTYIGHYPKQPGAYGEFIEAAGGTMIAKSQAEADKIAEAAYKRASHQSRGSFTCVGPVPGLEPFMLVYIDWDQDEIEVDWKPYQMWVVSSVTHRINFGNPVGGNSPSSKDWQTAFEAQGFSWTASANPPPFTPK